MTDAIAGTFSDIRFVKSRKVAQITVEIPIERAGDALALLGAPNPAEEVWVALARLKSNPGKGEKAEKARRKFSEMPLSQQAAIRCGELEFQLWLSETLPGCRDGRLTYSYERDGVRPNPAEQVRQWCNVRSRRDLDTNEVAGADWRDLEPKYQHWLGTRRAQQQHEAYSR